MNSFWPWALFGGALIGLSASMMLYYVGKITGMSGMLYGSVVKPGDSTPWKASFLGGLIVAGLIFNVYSPHKLAGHIDSSLWTMAVAGLLVGFGTRLGHGCTSGHGVCGVSRLSMRSILATLSFMIAGIASVYIFRNLGVLNL